MEHIHKFEVGKKYKSKFLNGSTLLHECIFKDSEGVVIRRTYITRNPPEVTCAWWNNSQANTLWDTIKEIKPEIVKQAYWTRLRSSGVILYSGWDSPPDTHHWEILSGPHEIRYQPE